MTVRALVVIAAVAAAGCVSRPPAPLGGAVVTPFVIEQALLGKTKGRGEFSAVTGAERGFDVDLAGDWDGETFTLVEDFRYDDGETDRKTWRLKKTGPGTYVGTREDVVGEAKAFMDGPALRLEYKIKLGDRVVGFRDVLVVQADGSILNEARIGWRGLSVGSVRLVIERDEAVTPPPS